MYLCGYSGVVMGLKCFLSLEGNPLPSSASFFAFPSALCRQQPCSSQELSQDRACSASATTSRMEHRTHWWWVFVSMPLIILGTGNLSKSAKGRAGCNIWATSLTIMRNRTSFLVVQRKRIQPPMQGTWLWPLVWEGPTCLGKIKPMHRNYWTQTLEPGLHNKRNHCNEKPEHCNEE